jgi:hypothetical protein
LVALFLFALPAPKHILTLTAAAEVFEGSYDGGANLFQMIGWVSDVQ